MRKGNLKRMAFVLTGIIVLFIAPLVVFAAIYSSKEKVNQFAPAQAKVQIEEKNNSAETQVQSFTFPATTDASGNYGVEKVAAVEETQNLRGEYMRVRFVPSWYDASGNGNIRAGVEDISDFKTIELDRSTESEAKYLLFKNSSGKTIISLELTEKKENGVVTERWSDDWEYKGDGVFQSKVPIKSGNGKKELLKKAEVSHEIYNKAKSAGLELHVDILADAIQTSGKAAEAREWDPPQP